MWSDESGLKECTKGNTHPPSPQWSWVGGVESNTHISCLVSPAANPDCVSGVRVGCGLQCPWRDGQGRLAVRGRLPRVRIVTFPKKTKPERQGVAGQETNKALHKSQKGQSKLVLWCLKDGDGSKTHSHPVMTNKTRWTQRPKGKWETLKGGNRMYRKWPKEKKKKLNTQPRFSAQTENTESQLMVLTP